MYMTAGLECAAAAGTSRVGRRAASVAPRASPFGLNLRALAPRLGEIAISRLREIAAEIATGLRRCLWRLQQPRGGGRWAAIYRGGRAVERRGSRDAAAR